MVFRITACVLRRGGYDGGSWAPSGLHMPGLSGGLCRLHIWKPAVVASTFCIPRPRCHTCGSSWMRSPRSSGCLGSVLLVAILAALSARWLRCIHLLRLALGLLGVQATLLVTVRGSVAPGVPSVLYSLGWGESQQRCTSEVSRCSASSVVVFIL